MGFQDSDFNTPVYTEIEKEPQRVIIISCEGRNTEPEYFKAIKNNLSDCIDVLLEIEIVPKEDNASDPKYVVCNLDTFIDKYDYKSEHDEMWVVWDRETVDSRKKHILEMIPECKKKNYNIAMTNPLFEFWLLLHVADINTYNKDTLYANDWVNEAKTRRYIDKELSKILKNGYNKKNFNIDIVTKENILKALEQEKLFENDLDIIIDNLGSNIGDLIKKILSKITE
jgi:hypothetical protein